MRLLLDSHYVLWLAFERDALNVRERSILFDPTNDLTISSVAIWELRIKWDARYVSGERKSKADPLDIFETVRRMEIPVIDLTGNHAAAALDHMPNHSDPFDHLLLTIAQELEMKLFTRDEKLIDHPLAYAA